MSCYKAETCEKEECSPRCSIRNLKISHGIFPLDFIKELRNDLDKIRHETKGQCYSTSVFCRMLFGGQLVYKVLDTEGGRHYWNRVGDFLFDLTSDQFGGDGITPFFEDYEVLRGAPRSAGTVGGLLRAYLRLKIQ